MSILDLIEKPEYIKIKQFLFPLVCQRDYLVTIICIFPQYSDHLINKDYH
jgi:hypothetical protein